MSEPGQAQEEQRGGGDTCVGTDRTRQLCMCGMRSQRCLWGGLAIGVHLAHRRGDGDGREMELRGHPTRAAPERVRQLCTVPGQSDLVPPAESPLLPGLKYLSLGFVC